jgi:hypothetical protein
VKEVPWAPIAPKADIRIWFGEIPQEDILGWSVISNQGIGLVWGQAYIEQNDGSVDATSVLSTSVIPENVSPTKSEDQKSEEKLLFHELGHTLGLRLEHESANTATTDKPNSEIDIATFCDEDSVMLYPGRELKTSGSAWRKFKNFCDPKATKYTHVLSKEDMAFLAVRQ